MLGVARWRVHSGCLVDRRTWAGGRTSGTGSTRLVAPSPSISTAHAVPFCLPGAHGRRGTGPVLRKQCPRSGRRLWRALASDDAWIIFTSGTTGTPKGVAVSHRSAAAFVDAEARLFLSERPIAPGDCVMASLSVGFDASYEEMWLAWRHGACLVPVPRSLVRAGAEIGDWLVDHGITVVSTVPTLAGLWSPEQCRGVRLLILGGEACPEQLAHRLAAVCDEVWNTYGPTETTVVACAARLRPDEPVRIGFPLAGWQLAVVDPAHGHPVRPGEVGELVISGVGTARYLDADKDAAAFAALPALGWARAYRSGDLVRADPEGLSYVGRADSQVKIRAWAASNGAVLADRGRLRPVWSTRSRPATHLGSPRVARIRDEPHPDHLSGTRRRDQVGERRGRAAATG